MKRSLRIGMMVLFLGMNVGFAWAQDETTFHIMNVIGAGVYVRQQPYEGADLNVAPVPVIKWRNEKFFIEGLKGGYIAYEKEGLRVDVIAAPRFLGYDADDSNALAGMENRKISLDGGAQVSITLPKSDGITMTIGILSDVLNEYKGQEGSIRFSKIYKGSFYQLVPSFGAIWQSHDMVNYYYGVRDHEVKAGRPSYHPDSAWNGVASLAVNMGLSRTRDVFLVTRVDADFLGSEIKKSPIINKNVTLGGLVSIVVKF